MGGMGWDFVRRVGREPIRKLLKAMLNKGNVESGDNVW